MHYILDIVWYVPKLWGRWANPKWMKCCCFLVFYNALDLNNQKILWLPSIYEFDRKLGFWTTIPPIKPDNTPLGSTPSSQGSVQHPPRATPPQNNTLLGDILIYFKSSLEKSKIALGSVLMVECSIWPLIRMRKVTISFSFDWEISIWYSVSIS